MPGLRPDQVQEIHKLLHERKMIHAIKLYREATGVGLAEAKSAIEEMARNEYTKPPDDVRDRDNPVLESRIKSLLSRNRKVDAVKIYREEFGVGLKEAKDAVDTIEASMRSTGSSSQMPYQSAISGDPFADADGNRRRVIAVAVAVLVGLCGVGMLFVMMSF
jgi:ribosomal protein L7/L12